MTLKGQYALRDVDHASFGARHENLKEDRRILSAAKMKPTESTFRRYKVDEDTRGGCVAIGCETTVGWQKTRFCCHFGAYNFAAFIAEVNITIRRHELVYWLSSERKMIDIEWPLHAILMLKSVFCVIFTRFYCLALEQNYGKAQLDRHRLSATKIVGRRL